MKQQQRLQRSENIRPGIDRHMDDTWYMYLLAYSELLFPNWYIRCYLPCFYSVVVSGVALDPLPVVFATTAVRIRMIHMIRTGTSYKYNRSDNSDSLRTYKVDKRLFRFDDEIRNRQRSKEAQKLMIKRPKPTERTAVRVQVVSSKSGIYCLHQVLLYVRTWYSIFQPRRTASAGSRLSLPTTCAGLGLQ